MREPEPIVESKVEENNYSLRHRDLSWLAFNRRVLEEAGNEDVPLFERIKFLAIHSSNLDEFFSVRVAELRQIIEINKKSINRQIGFKPKKTLRKIVEEVNDQLAWYSEIYNQQIIPELKKRKIFIYQGQELRKGHEEFVEHYFKSHVLSFLQPVILREDSENKFFLENGRPYLFIRIAKEDSPEQEILAMLNVPTESLNRFVQLPNLRSYTYFITIDDIIRHNLEFIFPGYKILGAYSAKLNRDADLHLDTYDGDIVQRIQKQLKKRSMGNPARFVYDSTMPQKIIGVLSKYFSLDEDELVSGGRYRNMKDLFQLKNPFAPKYQDPPQPPLKSKGLNKYHSIFEAIEHGDKMLHFPYQSYDYILQFFNEAAIDPSVTEIRISLYRIASQSFIVNALISAARNGKKVSAFIEATARFDEMNNLKWAKRMEEVGIQTHYSLEDMKVHAKIALVQREVNGSIKKYAVLGTGNFNEKTASVYADHSLLTCNEKLVNEVDDVFKYLMYNVTPSHFENLLVAPFNMIDRFESMIDYEIAEAKKGNEASMIIKVNNLEDPRIIDKIYKAVEADVEVDLIVRGICCVVDSHHPNLKLRRIIDRYLEHARIFLFHHGGENKVFMGSADWMRRNLYHRVEVIYPVDDDKAKESLTQLLNLQLKDNTKARMIHKDFKDKPFVSLGQAVRTQRDFYNWLKAKR